MKGNSLLLFQTVKCWSQLSNLKTFRSLLTDTILSLLSWSRSSLLAFIMFDPTLMIFPFSNSGNPFCYFLYNLRPKLIFLLSDFLMYLIGEFYWWIIPMFFRWLWIMDFPDVLKLATVLSWVVLANSVNSFDCNNLCKPQSVFIFDHQNWKYPILFPPSS